MLKKAKEFNKFFHCWCNDLEETVDFYAIARCDCIFYDVENYNIKYDEHYNYKIGKVLYEL